MLLNWLLGAGLVFAQAAPVERLTVNAGFRDWGPATVAGTTILAGNQTGQGGTFAIDMVSGKVKWAHRPNFPSGTGSVSTPPAVAGDLVITAYSAAYPGAVVGLSLATGKEVWRGKDPAQGAAPAVSGGLAYILDKNGSFYALDAATGRERWKVALSNRGGCASRPIVRDDTVYLTANASDVAKRGGNYLIALDAKTGQERWRYRAEAPYVHDGVCLRQPVVTEDTIFAAGDNYLYAVERATGRERWKPVEVRRVVEGRERPVEVFGLVDAGPVVAGMTSGFLITFDKGSGRTVWELPGKFRESSPAMAVAGRVLYFQGSPDGRPAVAATGTLYALDLDSKALLWSFSRVTAERNWAFGHVTVVDGGLWVDSYQALVKLQ
ncbi:MAG TPA: PQQ-binding-like beta-propeller repeat protein [Paludibaculum sp.]|jgi:outer membrane protein assembly factor BamB